MDTLNWDNEVKLERFLINHNFNRTVLTHIEKFIPTIDSSIGNHGGFHEGLIALLLVLIVAGLYVANVSAHDNSHWVSIKTYYTPSTEGGTLSVNYFDGATAYTAGPFTLVGKSAGSINIGTTSVPEGFKGSAVLSSTIPVYSTYVQFEKDNPRGFSRSFYSGFSAEQAGTKFFLPTVRSNNITTSTIGIQNVESYTITATINLIPITGTPVVTNVDIAPGASFVSVLDANWYRNH